MKKLLALFFLIIVIFYATDSDGGNVPGTQGTCTTGCVGLGFPCTGVSQTDYCASGISLVEYYASGNSCPSTTIDCGGGTKNGYCTTGKCITCSTGTRNCDGSASNGCEININTSASNCGACGTVCSSGVCTNGVCAACQGTPTNCGLAAPCVDCTALATETDPGNDIFFGGTCTERYCQNGSCNARNYADFCSGIQVAQFTLSGSTCIQVATVYCATKDSDNGNNKAIQGICREKWGDCIGGSCPFVISREDTCTSGLLLTEYYVGTRQSNPILEGGVVHYDTIYVCDNVTIDCGDGIKNGYCSTGKCTTCPTDTKNCDGSAANGCEINITNNPNNCGACGTVCSGVDKTGSCSNSACVSCASGTKNCDGLASNGCEKNTATDPLNCGSCGNACPAGTTCSNGTCLLPVNQHPVAVIDANISVGSFCPLTGCSGTPLLTVDFNGGRSSDLDGSIALYDWNFGAGIPVVSNKTVMHSFVVDGNYVVVLTVTDDKGATGSTTIDINVSAANQLPVAVIDANTVAGPCLAGCSGPAPLIVDFNGSRSSDPEGKPLTYDWNFGAGIPVVSNKTASHSFDGNYVVVLTVTDDKGAIGSTTIDINVSALPLNQPPTAVITASQISGNVPLPVNFYSTGSTDPEGGSLIYKWDFGTGTFAVGTATESRTFDTSGLKTVRLQVTDNQGLPSPIVSTTITVNALQPPTPATPTEGKFEIQSITLPNNGLIETSPMSADVSVKNNSGSKVDFNLNSRILDIKNNEKGVPKDLKDQTLIAGESKTFTISGIDLNSLAKNQNYWLEVKAIDSTGKKLASKKEIFSLIFIQEAAVPELHPIMILLVLGLISIILVKK